ncbi:uroporphyrinogen-III synthase [Edaphobacter bradus]|uniref:uroporphyrinogen-III synthase n=1 Tax=Edaphobacter bradus TaxID=2259016 RepID=UPI0021DF6878|nr:uroporphyrinogen-III synthase [Edaphobacter bradus]
MHTLHNKRILITRTRLQASDLAVQLEALGANPLVIPTIEIIPPDSYAPLDAALAQLDTFDWLIFTSANAVEVFAARRNPTSRSKKIAVIGPATARAVQGIGLHVDLIPPSYVAESLAEALAPLTSDKRILLIRAAEARDILPETLTRAGATVTIAEAYRNRIPPESIPALQQLFASPASYPDAITFTSASTARNLIALLEAAGVTLPKGITLASIGPITSQALRDLGLTPTLEATEPTIPSLVEILAQRL